MVQTHIAVATGLWIISLVFSSIKPAAANCTVGSRINPTSPYLGSGQYLNLREPANCRGNLTAWHFCYYNQNSNNLNDNPFVMWFRIWRPRNANIMDRVYNLQVDSETGTTSTGGPVLNCRDIPLNETGFFEVRENDILAVYIPPLVNSVQIIARDSAASLHFDSRRGAFPVLATRLQTNDLTERSTLGLHLYADITATPITSTSVTPTAEVTTPTSGSGNTGSEVALQESTMMGDTVGGGGNGDTIAAAVIIVLLLVAAGVAVCVVVGILLYKKRYRDQLKSLCFKDGERKKLTCSCLKEGILGKINCWCPCFKRKNEELPLSNGIDNLLYRRESDQILVQVPKKRKAHLYDIPRNGHGNYDVPKSIPVEHVPENYQVPKSPAHAAHAAHAAMTKSPARRGTDVYENMPSESDVNYINYCGDGELESEGTQEVFVCIGKSAVKYHTLLRQAVTEEAEEEDPYYAPPSDEEDIYATLYQQQIMTIPREQIQITEHIGSGHFGNVEKGIWKDSSNKAMFVALKSLASEENKIKFLQEAVIVGQFKHPNIVKLHGVVTTGKPVMLVLEYISKGDLKKNLTAMRPSPGQLVAAKTGHFLLSYSQQVAFGMHYLSNKGFVHRDLAARNVLVSRNNICKISDFGMSRDLAEDDYYLGHDGKVPVKWTAPEALHCKKYSTASDVWSYGCLLYEIWSLGHKPFKGFSNMETIEKVDSGYRLPPPPGCPKVLYDIMIQCWNPVPSTRPTFRDILATLLHDEGKAMAIPVEDASTHEQASLLGAPSQTGEGMYSDLQHRYLPDTTATPKDPDYEYV